LALQFDHLLPTAQLQNIILLLQTLNLRLQAFHLARLAMPFGFDLLYLKLLVFLLTLQLLHHLKGLKLCCQLFLKFGFNHGLFLGEDVLLHLVLLIFEQQLLILLLTLKLNLFHLALQLIDLLL